MKVLHVIDRLAVGGAERVFVSLVNNLRNAGVAVKVLLFETGHQLEGELAADMIDLKRSNKYNLITLYKAYKICSRYDIVHAHLRHVHAYIKLSQVLFGGTYKLILHDHSGVSGEVPFRLKGLFKPAFYIGVYKQQLVWAIEKLHVGKPHAFLLNNTVANTINMVANSPSGSMMMVGNIRRVKNIEFAIALARQLNKKLTVYGNVLDNDYYSELLNVIGGKDDVEIVQGVTDLSKVYSKHSIAIHTSKQETGPLVLLEYMLAGVFFVAFKTGDVADTLYNELKDCFADSFEIDEWVNKVNQFNDSQEQKEKLRELYLKYYSPEQVTDKCLQIYKSVHS